MLGKIKIMNTARPVFITAFLLCISYMVAAQQYKQQIGVRLGSTEQAIASGFTYRYFMNEKSAVEAIANLGGTSFALGALYQRFAPISGVENLQWFYGAGAYVGFRGFDNFGLMGIAGLDYQFTELPINLSLDWKPELNLIEGVAFRASAVAVSVRFAFGKVK